MNIAQISVSHAVLSDMQEKDKEHSEHVKGRPCLWGLEKASLESDTGAET